MTEEEVINIAKSKGIVCDYQMSAERFVFTKDGVRQVTEVMDTMMLTPDQLKAFFKKEFG